MANISLLTIHWGLSYGAVMQTYATVKLLEQKGHKVSVINLIHPSMRRFYFKLRSWLLLVMDLQFLVFKKRYFSHLTSKMYKIERKRLPKDIDYFVIGADQVWNRDLTSPIDLSFFVNFNENIKRVSLASSFGKDNWNEDENYTKAIKSLLLKFNALSVREDTGHSILKNVFELDSACLVDPTLAYGEFDELLVDDRIRNDIYTFFVSRSSEYGECADLISRELNLPLFKHTKYSFYFKNSPRNWLTYIRNASAVITDSFHGVVFSIIFKKQFFCLWGERSKSTRVTSLLNLLGLKDRYIESVEDYMGRKEQIHSSIDYTEVDKVLMVERAKFHDFVGRYIK